ncbi:MAG: helix-turn-helix transcriptional regulator [Synergistota bacterium]|nr:helix-turn-helix transcriptional regulator [Synergistota bacterium]
MHPLVRCLKPVVKGLALALGPDYEIVLHDVTDTDHSIVAIENGHITGRKMGDPLTDFGLFSLKKAEKNSSDFFTNFLTRSADGRRIRGNTLFIRDEDGTIAGYLCVNYDMTKAEVMKSVAEQLTSIGSSIYSEHFTDGGAPKSEDILERNLRLIREFLGKPLHLSSRKEKIQAVRKLEDEGFFLLKGAVEAFAQESGNSVFTVYGYLRSVRGENSSG